MKPESNVANFETVVDDELYSDANQIPSDVFNFVNLNSSYFLSKDYLVSVQESKFQGMSFFYYVGRSKGQPTSFFYFQIINLASNELNQIINLDPYGKILSGLSGVLDKFIFGVKRDKPHYIAICGNMILSGDHGIITNDNQFSKLEKAISLIKIELSKSGKVAAFIVKDFLAETDHIGKDLNKIGFNLFVMDPIMELALSKNWNSFDDYTNAMSAKYRLRTTTVRKKVDDFILKNLSIEELILYKDTYNALYKNVQQKSPIRLVNCEIDYLVNLLKNALGEVIIKSYINNLQKPVAFFCGIKNGNFLEAHHIGIDYKLNKAHALYQNILYDFIDLGIELKVDKISFGRTALEMKTTVGAIPINYNAYLRLENRFVNHLVKSFLPTEPDNNWTPRNPFKAAVL
jgi:hypothetical protein